MMAHVAEAAEASGRVLIVIEEGGTAIEAAAGAASRFASAFAAEIETLAINQDFAERAGGIDASALVKSANRRNDETGLMRVAQVQSFLGLRQQRIVEQASWRYGVTCRHTALEGDPIDRLSEVCASRGPWNIVVLSSPTSAATASTISSILANVGGATGIVTAPSRVGPDDGPIVIVAEDTERLPAKLRAASRLRHLCGRVHLVLAADKRTDLADLEAQVRLMTANHTGLYLEPAEPMLGLEGALDDQLRRLKPSFVIARFSGTLLPTPRSLVRTITVAAAPFLLVR